MMEVVRLLIARSCPVMGGGRRCVATTVGLLGGRFG